MSRLNGVDLPKNKRVVIALTYIFGVGPTLAEQLVKDAEIKDSDRVKDLSEQDLLKLRDLLDSHLTEGELRRKHQLDVRRLQDIGSYRGGRHKKGLPANGQRTHTNARTRRRKRSAVKGKAKPPKK